MNREEANQQVVQSDSPKLLLELPTGFGKTLLAINWLDSKQTEVDKVYKKKILIVVPRLVLIQSWKEEFRKWKKESYLDRITFVTYISFPKLIKDISKYKYFIFDECHHLSERCRDAAEYIINNDYYKCLFLSATVNKEIKYYLRNAETIKVTAKKAIIDGILPDPTVYLLPLELDNTLNTETIIKNPKGKYVVQIPYKDRFRYKRKDTRVVIPCTQRQYYNDLSSLIDWYKNKNGNPVMKNLWLHKAGERLKWLSEKKIITVRNILLHCDKERTLTFCSGILQTEKLGSYCINSKNKKSKDFLNDFNNKKINHITACDMLNEGINLEECRIGIYAFLNSSNRLIIQKLGK